MKARRFDFYPDDWLVGTASMTLEERGVYITICALIYSHGGPIPDDENELSRLCFCHWRTFRAIRQRLLKAGKISSRGGHVSVKRCSRELEKARKRVSKAVQNGLKGGRPRNEINVLDKPDGLQKVKPNRKLPSPSPSPSPPEEEEEEDSEATPLPPDDLVKAIFERGKRMLGANRGALLGKMRQQHGDVAVLEAIVACEGEGPSDPASFFVACLSRAPPKNGHGKQSPVTTLYEGALRAADKLDREEADRRVGGEAVVALLDGSRSR